MKKENKCSRTFLVTSFQGGIGKTFVASELAKAIHDKTGKNVALIELNLLRPSSLVESLDKEMGNKLDLFDYYTSNWGIYNENDLEKPVFGSSHHKNFALAYIKKHPETISTKSF